MRIPEKKKGTFFCPETTIMRRSRVNSDVGAWLRASAVLRLFVGLVHPPPKKFVLSNCDPLTGHGANVPKCRDDSDTCRQLWDNHAANGRRLLARRRPRQCRTAAGKKAETMAQKDIIDYELGRKIKRKGS